MKGNNSNLRLQISVYYKPKEHGDIKAQLKALSMERDSIYEGRAESEVARMLILSKLKELSEDLDTLRQGQLNL